MNIKKIISLIIVVCTMITSLVGCNHGGDEHALDVVSTTVGETTDANEITETQEATEDIVVEETECLAEHETTEPEFIVEIVEPTSPKPTEPKPTEPKPTEPTTNETTEETAEPTTESEPAEPTIGGQDEDENNKLINLGRFRLTAYCNCRKCCGQWAGGATASGVMPKANHTIAVDTRIIPFGTKIVIFGKTYVAEDTGSAIKGNRIDIYFDTHQEALNFGVKYADVYKVVS